MLCRHADPLGGLRGGDRDGSHGRPGARTLTVVAAAPEYNARGYPSRTFKGENDPSLGLPYERIRTQFPIKDTRNVHTRAMKLIKLVKKLSNVKEEVYAALNEWAAWEQDFPLLAIKSGLQLLKKDQEWLRIIQVCKWMLAKGQGKTLGTYMSMLEAYDRLERFDEMEALWARVLLDNLESVPRALFARMMALYAARDMHVRTLEVFGSMDAMQVRPDERILARARHAALQLGAPQLADELAQNYRPARTEFRYVNGKRAPVRVCVPVWEMDKLSNSRVRRWVTKEEEQGPSPEGGEATPLQASGDDLDETYGAVGGADEAIIGEDLASKDGAGYGELGSGESVGEDADEQGASRRRSSARGTRGDQAAHEAAIV